MLAEAIDDVVAELGRWVTARDSGGQDETDEKVAWKVGAPGRNNFGLVLVPTTREQRASRGATADSSG